MAKPSNIQPLRGSAGTEKVPKHIFWGLYGPSSAGKTNFISGLPNTLILRPPIEHTDSVKKPAKGVEEWVVRSHDELGDDVLEYLRHEGHKHAFVWLDSASGWQDTGLDDVWEDLIALRPHRKKTPIDKGEYNANFVRLARFIRACVGCDQFNFGFTAWPEELVDAETGETKLMPWIQGKNMANRFVGYMKFVTYYERKEIGQKENKKMARVLRWKENPDHFTKDQYQLDRLPLDKGYMVNPTMPQMMERIEAARELDRKAARLREGTSVGTRKRTTTGKRRPPVRRTNTRKGSK